MPASLSKSIIYLTRKSTNWIGGMVAVYADRFQCITIYAHNRWKVKWKWNQTLLLGQFQPIVTRSSPLSQIWDLCVCIRVIFFTRALALRSSSLDSHWGGLALASIRTGAAKGEDHQSDGLNTGSPAALGFPCRGGRPPRSRKRAVTLSLVYDNHTRIDSDTT